jgi:diacylglycerol kinase family enzyme
VAGGAAPLLLVNPFASRLADPWRRERLLDDASAAIRRRTGRDPDVAVPEDVGEARAWLTGSAAAGRELVVAAGGDGTIREATHDLAGTGVALAIVPLGTANLFAASVGVPLDPQRALDTIATGGVRSVDLGRARWSGTDGRIHERVFAVGCGAGFDARLIAATGSGAKRRLGRYGYFASALRLVGDVRGFEASVEVDGETHDLTAVAVIVANAGELIPGLLRPALPIRVADGLLDVFVVAAHRLPGAMVGAIKVVARRSLGRSATGRSVRLRGTAVRVVTRPAQPLEVDGDPVGAGWLEATVLPSALRVVVARPRHQPAAPPPSGHDSEE